jgi:RimJ/RimL family protein N-acetyltransferase
LQFHSTHSAGIMIHPMNIQDGDSRDRPSVDRIERRSPPMLPMGKEWGRETEYVLRPFSPDHAAPVASWVDSVRTRRWVSPSAAGEVTAELVNRWVKPGGEALVLADAVRFTPIAYGELNPMRAERRHYWLGHLIVAPAYRGFGIGFRLTQELLAHAFLERLAQRVSLIVFPDNSAAVRCYTKAGFRLTGEEFHRFGASARASRLLRFQLARAQFDEHAHSGERCATIG